MEPQLTNQQKQDLDDQLKRADAFEGMVGSKGWEYVKAYFTNRVQSFANGILTSKEPIEKFEGERDRLAGLRELIGFIDSDIDALRRYRERQKGK